MEGQRALTGWDGTVCTICMYGQGDMREREREREGRKYLYHNRGWGEGYM